MGQDILITILAPLHTLSLVLMCHHLCSPPSSTQLTSPKLEAETPTFRLAQLSSSYGLGGLTELFHVSVVHWWLMTRDSLTHTSDDWLAIGQDDKNKGATCLSSSSSLAWTSSPEANSKAKRKGKQAQGTNIFQALVWCSCFCSVI